MWWRGELNGGTTQTDISWNTCFQLSVSLVVGGGKKTKKLWDFSTHLVNLYLYFVPVLFLSNEC